jgi:glucoamylase
MTAPRPFLAAPPTDTAAAAQSMTGREPLPADWAPDLTFDAPGAPGIPPTWTSSDKDAVGCSLGPARLWFTIGYGIINEVYWPRVDLPQIRDLGFIVADGKGFWAEVKRCGDYAFRSIVPGAAAFEVVHTDTGYNLRLRISPDPRRDVLAIETVLESTNPDLRVYALLAPRLGTAGIENRAIVGQHHGRTILWAESGPFALALAAADPKQQDAVGKGSAGYVGSSDGWQDFARNGAMTWSYPAAGPGNVALMAELPRHSVLALGFGSSREAAATLALSTIMQPFENLLQEQLSDWKAWHQRCGECRARPLDLPPELQEQFLVSTTVLRAHLDKTYPGAMVASLSIPWGNSGNERGGYHLVWPRDLVECAGALLAFGGEAEARDTLQYLMATQNADGHWNQNQWLGGQSYWRGVQLDEAAFPVLLAAALADRDALAGIDVEDMVRRALGFVTGHGPSSDQDRWEETAGINAFTLAVCIAALVAGSAFLNSRAKQWALDIADFWNASIDGWLVVSGTELAREVGVPAYHIRMAPSSVLQNGSAALHERVPLRNHATDVELTAAQQVGVDFLQLVRFGLRDAKEPLILDSIKVADRLLKVDTPAGSVWRRYNLDGYGEHEDGSAYDGTGVGRPWPLLAGERGHYELVAGRDPLSFLHTMAAMTSTGGMIPEQVWDEASIPSHHLSLGRPTGSAMPLVWAHAEFVKLIVSRALGEPFDRPQAVWSRYKGQRRSARCAFWWLHARIGSFPAGSALVIALPRPGIVRYGIDCWRIIAEADTEDTNLGFYAACLDTAALKPGQNVEFTIRWNEDDWIGEDFGVQIIEAPHPDEPPQDR